MQTGLHTGYMGILALRLHFACASIDDTGLTCISCLFDRTPGRSGESKTVRRGDIKYVHTLLQDLLSNRR